MNLAELGLESGVNLVESTTERGELLTSLIGDQHLGHPFPVYSSSCFERHIDDFLSCSAHFLSRFRTFSLTFSAAKQAVVKETGRARERVAFF